MLGESSIAQREIEETCLSGINCQGSLHTSRSLRRSRLGRANCRRELDPRRDHDHIFLFAFNIQIKIRSRCDIPAHMRFKLGNRLEIRLCPRSHRERRFCIKPLEPLPSVGSDEAESGGGDCHIRRPFTQMCRSPAFWTSCQMDAMRHALQDLRSCKMPPVRLFTVGSFGRGASGPKYSLSSLRLITHLPARHCYVHYRARRHVAVTSRSSPVLFCDSSSQHSSLHDTLQMPVFSTTLSERHLA